MSIIKSAFATCFLVVLFTSCGGDSKDKLIRDIKGQMLKMAVLYEGIKDVPTAKVALTEIDNLIEAGKAMDKRREVLNIPRKEIDDAIKADREILAIMKRYTDALQGLMKKPEVFKILDEKMKAGK